MCVCVYMYTYLYIYVRVCTYTHVSGRREAPFLTGRCYAYAPLLAAGACDSELFHEAVLANDTASRNLQKQQEHRVVSYEVRRAIGQILAAARSASLCKRVACLSLASCGCRPQMLHPLRMVPTTMRRHLKPPPQLGMFELSLL